MRNRRRLTEGDIRRIIRKTIKSVLREEDNAVEQLHPSDQRIYNACVDILSQRNENTTINDLLDSEVKGLSYAEAEEVCSTLYACVFDCDTIFDDNAGERHSLVNQKVANLLKQNERLW